MGVQREGGGEMERVGEGREGGKGGDEELAKGSVGLGNWSRVSRRLLSPVPVQGQASCDPGP